jgi:DNA-binding NtrC family response regulator
MNTPDRDGMQLLEKVRAEFPEVAFVMITGTDDVRRGVQLIREGASDYLLRPFQMDTVI